MLIGTDGRSKNQVATYDRLHSFCGYCCPCCCHLLLLLLSMSLPQIASSLLLEVLRSCLPVHLQNKTQAATVCAYKHGRQIKTRSPPTVADIVCVAIVALAAGIYYCCCCQCCCRLLPPPSCKSHFALACLSTSSIKLRPRLYLAWAADQNQVATSRSLPNSAPRPPCPAPRPRAVPPRRLRSRRRLI